MLAGVLGNFHTNSRGVCLASSMLVTSFDENSLTARLALAKADEGTRDDISPRESGKPSTGFR